MNNQFFKRIPFDLELAKKITNKEVEGQIVTRNGLKARIVCFDFKYIGGKKGLAVLVEHGDFDVVLCFNTDGKEIFREDRDTYITSTLKFQPITRTTTTLSRTSGNRVW